MKPTEFKLLSKLFEAEFLNQLPYQLNKSKLREKFLEDHLIMPMTTVLGGRFKVVIDGFQLTERGRYLYCQECAKTPDP